MKNIIKKIIDSQKYISQKFDLLLPKEMTVFANDIFDYDVLPRYLKAGQKVSDIGGGKHPNVSIDQKNNFNLKVVGVDISQEELDQAPDGFYDDAIAADITKFEGSPDNDIIICRALLEHVPDVQKSIENISKMTKQGGHVLIFGPCKNALFSRINMMLPNEFKRKLLHFTFPSKQKRLGFKAYYDRCTPKEFENIAKQFGLKVKEKHICYNSQYFSIFAPFHILWRLYQLIIYGVKAENLCEAYVLVLVKSE